MAKRLSPEEWRACRLKRETTGASFPALADEFGVSHQAIQKRAKAEGWSDGTDGNLLSNRIAREKVATAKLKAAKLQVAGEVAEKDAACNFANERIDAIVAEAEEKAGVIMQHQADWKIHRESYAVDSDAELLRQGKLAAEMLKLRQDGERKAYGLDVEVQATAESAAAAAAAATVALQDFKEAAQALKDEV